VKSYSDFRLAKKPFFSFVASVSNFSRMYNLKYCLLFLITCLNPVFLLSQVRPPDLDENAGQEESQVNESNIESKIGTWNIKGYGTFILETNIDTSLNKINIYHPVYKKSITNSYTGNYGGAYLDNNFFSRQYQTNFLFLQTHDAYLLTPQTVIYYNTTTPYTLLDYSQSENKNRNNETRFNVLHTRNINPDWNVTFRFDQARSDGQYLDQENKNHFVTLYSSYNSDKLDLYGGFISNRIRNQENGGIKADSMLFEETKFFNLIDARSEYKSNYFYSSTRYKHGKYVNVADENGEEPEVFVPRFGLTHYFEYSNNLHQFWEDNVNFEFFPETLIDSTGTNDSTRFRKITNILQAQQFESAEKKASFGKRAYIGVDFVKVLYRGYINEVSDVKKYTDIYIGGGIFRELGKFWTWNFEGRFYLTGFHSGQTIISGEIAKPLVLFRDSLTVMEITGKLENLIPGYFQQRYHSNHLVWYNTFNDEQRMTAGINIKSHKRKFKIGANYALINNYIYNNARGIPSQTKKELLVVAGYIDKKFAFGNFSVDTRLLAQKASSNEFIHLPDFSAFLGISYRMLISKVLYTQLGVDTRYNTKYYADAYDPTTSLFYLQNEKEIGNYPYINAYANLRLKRTRVYFKLINIGTSFMNGEYFTALHYPMNKMTFRLGVDWKFYD